MDMDYLDFLAWVDRCLFPVDLAEELIELGLEKPTGVYYEIEWKQQKDRLEGGWNIVRLYQNYCVGRETEADGKDVGHYLKLWLEQMHENWKNY
jgi:hypothetical protein